MRTRIPVLLALVLLIGIFASPGSSAQSTMPCTDPLGCVKVGPNEPLKLATLVVLTGPGSFVGIDSQRGVELAAALRGGSLLGRPIQFVHFDAPIDDNATLLNSTAQILADETITATIGPSGSRQTRQVAPLFSDAGMVLISPTNTGTDLTDPATHEPFYLRTAYNDRVNGSRMAAFAVNELGLKTAATIDDGNVFEVPIRQAFVAAFTAAGGTIVAQEQVPAGATDFTSALAAVAAEKPDFLFCAQQFTDQMAAFVQQARATKGLKHTELGLPGDALFDGPNFLSGAGAAAEAVYVAAPDFEIFGLVQPFGFPNPDYANVVLPAYEARFGTPTFWSHAHAYDATNIVLNAIEEVAVQQGANLLIGRQALRDALFATTDYPGLIGNVTCNSNGDCNPNVFFVHQVQDAAFVQVSP